MKPRSHSRDLGSLLLKGSGGSGAAGVQPGVRVSDRLLVASKGGHCVFDSTLPK